LENKSRVEKGGSQMEEGKKKKRLKVVNKTKLTCPKTGTGGASK